MRVRSTRLLLIAVLLLALSPGATLEACMQSGPASCCCSDDCPEPGEARIERGSCCEMSNRAPAPARKPVTVAPAPVKPLDDIAARCDVAITTVPVAQILKEIRPTGRTKPLPLFTLHAALLI